VRAVNLIPSEARRGGVGAPSRSGGGVYVLLGVLAVLVIGAGAYVLAGNTVNQRRADLAEVTAQANRVEAEAAELKPFSDFAKLSQERIQTVSSLAASRFDWERSLRDLSKVLPANVWVTSVVGTVAPGISIEGGGSAGSGLRGSIPSPAIEMVGCTESHRDVSRVMARLRRMRGVTRVSLGTSEKSDTASAGSAQGAGAAQSAGSSQDCRNGSRTFPKFELVAFFAGQTAASGSAPQAAGTPPAAAGASASSSAQSSPGSTTPTSPTAPTTP